jgi:hypothetical protein
VVCGMAWFLTFPCPLLQLRAVSPSRRQLLHFWGDFLFREPTRLPTRRFRSGHRYARSNQRGRTSPTSPCRAAKLSCCSTFASFGAASTPQRPTSCRRALSEPSPRESG